jgi:hypothetical protein
VAIDMTATMPTNIDGLILTITVATIGEVRQTTTTAGTMAQEENGEEKTTQQVDHNSHLIIQTNHGEVLDNTIDNIKAKNSI